MARHLTTLLGISTLAVADVTLTFTKTWNNIDITVLPTTTISGGCKATAVVTVTGVNSLDALSSLRDLPCPTGGSGGPGSSETRPVVSTATSTTTPTTLRGATDTAPPLRPTAQPNAASGHLDLQYRGMGTNVVLVGLATAVHLMVF